MCDKFVTFTAICLGISTFFTAVECAQAQTLDNSDVSIVKKSQRRSSQKFRGSITLEELGRDVGAQLPKGISRETQISVAAHVFRNTEIQGSVYYDGLPDCGNNQRRRLEIFPSERGLEKIDLIAYRFNSARQKKRASQISNAFPYIPGDLSNPYRDPRDGTQTFLRILGLRCLPTAVKHVQEKGQAFLEYREGESAWALQVDVDQP